jgi:Uma2 family endonuclease
MSSQPQTPISASEYLEIERKAEYKSEYCAGEMFAMAGATRAHNLLAANMLALIHGQFRQRDCQVYGSDMRVAVNPAGLYTYPDVSAVCGEERFLDQHSDTLLNPAVIVEVLSISTEAYDRGRKFELYRALDSLQQYVLVASDRIHADVFTRSPDGRWVLRSLDAADSMELDSIGCRLLVSELYEKTDLLPA